MTSGFTRAFLALLLPESVIQEAAGWSDRLRRDAPPGSIRWVPSENFHLTVRFFGDLDAVAVARARDFVRSFEHRFDSIPVRLSSVSAFPSQARPQVVWIGIESSGSALERWVREIDERLVAAGFGPADKPWKSHLTLGRVQRDVHLPAPVTQRLFAGFPLKATGSVDTLVLFESKLSSSGATYRPLATARAAGSAGG